MEFLLWMIVGVALMAVELVLPGGIAGFVGYCFFMWGVFIALGETTTALYVILGISVIIGILLITFFNRFSQTWLGRLFTLGLRSTAKQGYVSNDILSELVGKRGVAKTTLRPAGTADIEDMPVDVVTEGEFIDAGTPIIVMRVVGGRNIVRKL